MNWTSLSFPLFYTVPKKYNYLYNYITNYIEKMHLDKSDVCACKSVVVPMNQPNLVMIIIKTT